MAWFYKVKELEAKKRALAAESEAYRQMLALEVENLRLYGGQARQQFAAFRTPNPLMKLLSLLGSPLASFVIGRRRSRWLRVALTGLMGWQFYRRFSPFLQHFFRQDISPSQNAGDASEEKAPAANV